MQPKLIYLCSILFKTLFFSELHKILHWYVILLHLIFHLPLFYCENKKKVFQKGLAALYDNKSLWKKYMCWKCVKQKIVLIKKLSIVMMATPVTSSFPGSSARRLQLHLYRHASLLCNALCLSLQTSKFDWTVDHLLYWCFWILFNYQGLTSSQILKTWGLDGNCCLAKHDFVVFFQSLLCYNGLLWFCVAMVFCIIIM